ncbi:TPA: hypothetical protein DDW35_01185 [Candidatus Sumerlaeota bacterium]|nr:hypothetical protein [Candidatus Sumerlaeota bacterium]
MNKDLVKFSFVMSLTIGRMPLILIYFLVNLLLWRQTPEGWHLQSAHAHAFWFCVAFGSMVLSALTDAFDGYYARKFKMETNFGAYADPMTDKIFYLVAFPTLVYLAAVKSQTIPAHAALLLGLTVIFLLRDQWVSFMRSIGAIHGVSAKANWSGKARTAISFPVICAIYWYLMAPPSWQFLPDWLVVLAEVVSLIINLISIWVYSVSYWPCVRKELEKPFEKR